jgi:tetratricopeptide (TPR) repeat protein
MKNTTKGSFPRHRYREEVRILGLHLNDDQFEEIVNSKRTDDKIPDHIDRTSQEDMRAHLDVCEECTLLLRTHQAAQAQLGGIKDIPTPEKGPDCPPESVWIDLAAGLHLDGTDAHMRHVAQCDHCGSLLKQAIMDFCDELSPTEHSQIAALNSSKPHWRKRLAKRLATTVHSDPRTVNTSTRRWSRAQISLLWYAAAFALLICAMVLGIRTLRQTRAQILLAEAYSQQRTLELRIPDAQFSPLQHPSQTRSTGEQLHQTASLLEARTLIARALEHNPNDPLWLELEARADLLDGNVDRSLDLSSRLLLNNPLDRNLLLDASSAYFERGVLSSNPQDIGLCIDLLGRLLAQNPRDLIALYNQAVAFEYLYQYDNAARRLKEYLVLDSTSAWATDARRRLDDIEEKQRRREGSSYSRPLSLDELRSLAIDVTSLASRDEELATTGFSTLLDDAYPSDRWETGRRDNRDPTCGERCVRSRALLAALALSLQKTHGDPWIADLLNSCPRPLACTSAMRALSAAMGFDARGLPTEGLRGAVSAIAAFEASHDRAGRERAKVERLYAYQRLPGSAEDLFVNHGHGNRRRNARGGVVFYRAG